MIKCFNDSMRESLNDGKIDCVNNIKYVTFQCMLFYHLGGTHSCQTV